MSEAASSISAHGVESLEDTLHLLRTRVLLVALNVLAIGMPLACLFLGVQAYVAGTLTTLTVALCLWSLIFPMLRALRTRMSFRASALVLLSVLLVSAAMVASRGGLTIGSLSASVLLI